MPKNNCENAMEEESVCSDGNNNNNNNNKSKETEKKEEASPVRRSKRKRLTKQPHTPSDTDPSPSHARKNKRQRKPSLKAEESSGAKGRGKGGAKGKHTSNNEDEAALKELIRPKRKYRKKSQTDKLDKNIEKENQQSPSKSSKSKSNQSQDQDKDQDQDSGADDSLDEHDMACCICRCTVDYSDMDQFNWPQEELDSDSDSDNDGEEESETESPSKDGHAKEKEHGDKGKDTNHNPDVDADPEKEKEKEVHNEKDSRGNIQENKDHNDSLADAVAIANKEQKHNSQSSEQKSTTAASSIVSREKESLTTQSFQNNQNDNGINIDNESSEQSDFYGVKLPYDLHDPNNALLICDGDGCNRCFHQRCHFVPVLTVPRRDWFCLICQYKAKRIAATKGKGKRGRKSKSPKKLEIEIKEVEKDITKSEPLTVAEIENIYRVETIDRLNADTFIGGSASASAVSTINGNGHGNSAASPSASASATTKTPPRKDECAQEDAIITITLEQRFEYHSAQLKAELTRKGSQQLVKTIDHNLSSIRLCQNSIRALIETNNRARKALIEKYNKTHQLPQELVQNVMRLARCKLKLREVMLTLQNVIRNKDDRRALSEWFNRAKTEGRFTPARICQKNPPVPEVISLESTIDTCTAVGERECNQKTEIGIDIHVLEGKLFAGDRIRTEPRFDITDYDADADEESEEEDPTSKIKCCVCFSGDVEEDNDVIMCDGEHCFRAFHMQCCAPHVTQKMLDEDKYGVWFCPYCVCFAKTVHYTQTEYNGYEDDDGASIGSWEKAEDIFPEAQAEVKAAEKWKLGKRNDDSDKVLAEMLGIEIAKAPCANDAKEGGDDGNNDDDDDEDESDFGSDAVSEGSAKSNASDSASSVDWGVHKSELSALSCSESESDSGEDDDKNENGNETEEGSKKTNSVRKSKRLKRGGSNGNSVASGSSQSKPPTDIGALDTANIVRGKRSRASVDYNSLNDSMFGKVKGSAIDDEEEYQFVMKKSSGKSDSDSDNASSSEDEVGSDNSDDDSSKSDSNEDAESNKKTVENVDVEGEETKDDAKPSNRKPRQSAIFKKSVVVQKKSKVKAKAKAKVKAKKPTTKAKAKNRK